MNGGRHMEIWNVYPSAGAPIGDAERRERLGRSVAGDILYTDPVSQTQGIDALVGRIGESQRRFPGAHFRNDSFFEHHDQGLFHWTMLDSEKAEVVKGTSYARFGAEGKLVQATGFFEV